MKQLICTMLILSGIMGTLCAQRQVHATIGKTFEVSSDRIHRRFWIDIGKGNRLCLELQNEQDLDKFSNIDSLLMVFLDDMKPFIDSFTDPLSWHIIDYVSDADGKKKVRIQTFHPTASSFLLDQTEPAALRLEQDTIRIILQYPAASARRYDGIEEDRLSIYLNSYHELTGLVTGGLNEKMRWLKTNMNNYWVRDKNVYRAGKDPTISAPQPAGFIAQANDYLGSIIEINVGNYKNYFAPSFSLGFGAHFISGESKQSFSARWQPLFLFGTNAQGHAQTSRNDFLDFSYSREWRNPRARNMINLNPSLSFGWLIHREGDYFEKNSKKLFLGHLNLYHNNIVLQPGMYFYDFFKGVTPAVVVNISL